MIPLGESSVDHGPRTIRQIPGEGVGAGRVIAGGNLLISPAARTSSSRRPTSHLSRSCGRAIRAVGEAATALLLADLELGSGNADWPREIALSTKFVARASCAV